MPSTDDWSNNLLITTEEQPSTEEQDNRRVELTEFEHEEIARLAYSYWEARGCIGGSAEADWQCAIDELWAHRLREQPMELAFAAVV